MGNSKIYDRTKKAEVWLPVDSRQNEKKMPTYHHPTESPKPKKK